MQWLSFAASDNVQGISLSVDQYKALLKAVPAINAQLSAAGIQVGDNASEASEVEDKPQKRAKPKKEEKKANIEATSDEEEQ